MVVMAASPRAADTSQFPLFGGSGGRDSPGYGRWVATVDREIRLTYYALMWKEGLGNGYQRVQDILVLSESGNGYVGHSKVDFSDASGKSHLDRARPVSHPGLL